jgi:cyclophilin family peptidyl-prolyl cis-trans isomerase
VGKQAKRERQRQNREAAREERERMIRRRKQTRLGVTLGILLVVVIGLAVILSANNSSSKTAAPYAARDIAGQTYEADIQTNFGTIKTILDSKVAPKGVKNFVDLARAGKYDGLTWHRVVKDFVIQGGDPKGDGSGSMGPGGIGEPPPGNKFALGDLAYAKSGAEANLHFGSQFFVITSTNGLSVLSQAPIQYAYFGSVKDAASLAVAKRIEALAPAAGGGKPTKPALIVKITIIKLDIPATTTTTAGATVTTVANTSPTASTKTTAATTTTKK